VSADCAVVIPLFNGARWILQALDSILAQTRPPAEVVVVEDGSTDDSPRLVETYGRGVLLLRGEKRGPPAARNLGLGRTRSSFVAFLDQDDVWHPRHLEFLADALARNAEAPAAMAGFDQFHDGTGPDLAVVDGPDGAYDPWEGFPLLNAIHCPSSVLVRRESLETAGLWDPRYTGVADVHLWLRLSVRRPFVCVPSVTVGRRLHLASYLQKMVSSDPLGRLRLLAEAVEDALEYRLASVGDERERDRLSNRLALVGCALDLARSYAAEDRAGFKKAALEAERILAGELESLRRGLFLLLTYSVCPSAASVEGREKMVTFLTVLPARWPSSAPSTRRSLLRYVDSVRSGGPAPR
jgi:glycosyltransferase involved in cell wall biosynthesis